MKYLLMPLLGALLFISAPVYTNAAGPADAVCIAWWAQCQKGKCPPPPKCQHLQCTGICTGPICTGMTCTQGDGTKTGASAGGAEEIMKMAQSKLNELESGK